MHFLALVNDVAVIYGGVDVGDFVVVYRNAALGDEPARFAVGGTYSRRNEHGDYCSGFYRHDFFGQVVTAAERRFCLVARGVCLSSPWTSLVSS